MRKLFFNKETLFGGVHMKKKLLTLVVALGSMLAVSTSVLAEDTMYVPIPSYRVGPYAAGGTGYFGGILDYYNLLNERDGGVNGVKLIWSECETEYSVERGVECYKRLKDREGGAVFFDPLSVGISTALIETGRKDKMPIIAVNHGKDRWPTRRHLPLLLYARYQHL